MKKFFLSCTFLAGVLVLGACHKSNNGPGNTAGVMFVNGCVGATAVNVTASGTAVNSATNLAFGKNTGYNQITAGGSVPIAFSINANGLITPLISGNVSITAGSNYSVYTGGIFTRPTFVYTTDDLTAPPSGFAKVRFANLAADTLNESCFIGSQKIDSNVAYASITPFFQVAASSGTTVLFQDPAVPTHLAQLSNQTFSSGRIYTVLITGTSSAAAGSASVLTLSVINNN